MLALAVTVTAAGLMVLVVAAVLSAHGSGRRPMAVDAEQP